MCTRRRLPPNRTPPFALILFTILPLNLSPLTFLPSSCGGLASLDDRLRLRPSALDSVHTFPAARESVEAVLFSCPLRVARTRVPRYREVGGLQA